MIRTVLVVNTEKLKRARKLKGFSYRDMSSLLGAKSPATYYNIENGIVEPKVGQALKISKLFQKPVTIFFELKVQY